MYHSLPSLIASSCAPRRATTRQARAPGRVQAADTRTGRPAGWETRLPAVLYAYAYKYSDVCDESVTLPPAAPAAPGSIRAP